MQLLSLLKVLNAANNFTPAHFTKTQPRSFERGHTYIPIQTLKKVFVNRIIIAIAKTIYIIILIWFLAF